MSRDPHANCDPQGCVGMDTPARRHSDRSPGGSDGRITCGDPVNQMYFCIRAGDFRSASKGKIMKKVLLLICTLLFGIPAFAQSLTPAERERGVQYLEQTRDGVVAGVNGLSGAQVKFKPARDRWSVAETLEHIALAENDAHNLFAQAMK